METSSPARPARARIGLVTKALGGETDPGSVAVNAAVRSAVEDMRTAGADVVEVEIPRTILTVMAKNSLDALTYPATRVPAPSNEERDQWTVLTFPTNTLIARPWPRPGIS